jgi:pilus assembly protein CpaB
VLSRLKRLRLLGPILQNRVHKKAGGDLTHGQVGLRDSEQRYPPSSTGPRRPAEKPMKKPSCIAILILSGCVSTGTHEKLKADYETALYQLQQRDASLAQCSQRSSAKEAELKRGWTLAPVIAAAEDIPEGTVITYQNISQRPVPEQFVTSSVVKPDSASYIVGQKVLVPVQAGDLMLWSMFETTNKAERLSTCAQKGMRIFTLETSPSSGCGGWARPNDHVDVIAVLPTSGTKGFSATTVVENALIVATGKITGTTNANLLPENERSYSQISLLVRPEDAERLALAQALGKLTLSLRPATDDGVRRGAAPVTENALFTPSK